MNILQQRRDSIKDMNILQQRRNSIRHERITTIGYSIRHEHITTMQEFDKT